jgi:hypothetical protein
MVSILFNGTQIDLLPAVFQDKGHTSFKHVFQARLSNRDFNDVSEISFNSVLKEKGAKLLKKRNVMAPSKYFIEKKKKKIFFF